MSEQSPGDERITIPDELFDRFEFGDTDAGEEDQDAGDEDSLSGGEEDTLEEDEAPDGDDGDTEDSEDGLEEDEDEEGDPEEDEEEDAGGAFFDRKSIDRIKDPEARRVAQQAYKSMQRAFTQKTEEVADLRRRAGEYVQEYESFVGQLETDQGMEHFLSQVVRARPKTFTKDLLVDAALANPELFDQVVSAVQRLVDDEDALEVHRDKRDTQLQKQQLQQREEREERQARSERARAVRTLVAETAAGMGVRSQDSLEIVEGQVALLLRRNADQGRKTTRQQIVDVVERTAGRIGKERDRARQDEGRQRRERSQGQVRKLARNASRAQPPKGGAPRSRKPLTVPTEVPDDEAIGVAARRYLGLK